MSLSCVELRLCVRALNLGCLWLKYSSFNHASMEPIKKFTSHVRCFLSFPEFIKEMPFLFLNHPKATEGGRASRLLLLCRLVTYLADILRLLNDLSVLSINEHHFRHLAIMAGTSLIILFVWEAYRQLSRLLLNIVQQRQQPEPQTSNNLIGLCKSIARILFGYLLIHQSVARNPVSDEHMLLCATGDVIPSLILFWKGR